MLLFAPICFEFVSVSCHSVTIGDKDEVWGSMTHLLQRRAAHGRM